MLRWSRPGSGARSTRVRREPISVTSSTETEPTDAGRWPESPATQPSMRRSDRSRRVGHRAVGGVDRAGRGAQDETRRRRGLDVDCRERHSRRRRPMRQLPEPAFRRARASRTRPARWRRPPPACLRSAGSAWLLSYFSRSPSHSPPHTWPALPSDPTSSELRRRVPSPLHGIARSGWGR